MSSPSNLTHLTHLTHLTLPNTLTPLGNHFTLFTTLVNPWLSYQPLPFSSLPLPALLVLTFLLFLMCYRDAASRSARTEEEDAEYEKNGGRAKCPAEQRWKELLRIEARRKKEVEEKRKGREERRMKGEKERRKREEEEKKREGEEKKRDQDGPRTKTKIEIEAKMKVKTSVKGSKRLIENKENADPRVKTAGTGMGKWPKRE